jgi:hypothetical protein
MFYKKCKFYVLIFIALNNFSRCYCNNCCINCCCCFKCYHEEVDDNINIDKVHNFNDTHLQNNVENNEEEDRYKILIKKYTEKHNLDINECDITEDKNIKKTINATNAIKKFKIKCGNF